MEVFKIDPADKTSVSVVFRIVQAKHIPAGIVSHFRDPDEKEKTQTALQHSKGTVLFTTAKSNKRVAPPGNFVAFMRELGFKLGGADYDGRPLDYDKTHHMFRSRFYRDPAGELELEDLDVFEAALKEMAETALWDLTVFNNGLNLAFLFAGRWPYRHDDGSPILARPEGTRRWEKDLVKPVRLVPSLVFKADPETKVISLQTLT